jgi:hypothetical protein
MFEVGKSYMRRQLHDKYGGQRQGGISTPAKHPLIFLFTGGGGEKWGYRDHWAVDGTFRFSGEGSTAIWSSGPAIRPSVTTQAKANSCISLSQMVKVMRDTWAK